MTSPAGLVTPALFTITWKRFPEWPWDMGKSCPNPDCGGACYHCLLGYRNQRMHNLLDRGLAVSVLEYLLHGERPRLSRQQVAGTSAGLDQYTRAAWDVEDGGQGPPQFCAVFEASGGRRLGVYPVHPFSARPMSGTLRRLLERTGISPRVYTSFDLLRRPFWVANQLFQSSRR